MDRFVVVYKLIVERSERETAPMPIVQAQQLADNFNASFDVEYAEAKPVAKED
jgi:hypothetical protein